MRSLRLVPRRRGQLGRAAHDTLPAVSTGADGALARTRGVQPLRPQRTHPTARAGHGTLLLSVRTRARRRRPAADVTAWPPRNASPPAQQPVGQPRRRGLDGCGRRADSPDYRHRSYAVTALPKGKRSSESRPVAPLVRPTTAFSMGSGYVVAPDVAGVCSTSSESCSTRAGQPSQRTSSCRALASPACAMSSAR